MLPKNNITILTVNFNSYDFVKLMIESLEQLTYNKFKVLICDNGSTKKEIKKINSFCKKRKNIQIFYKKQNDIPSISHGRALDFLVKKVVSKYFVVMDADATFLIQDWDLYLISELNEKVKLIGTEASGNKEKSFPQVYATLYETKTFKRLKCFFCPDIKKNVSPSNDTGYIIPIRYSSNGYKGKILKYKNTRYWKKGPYNDLICGEYYLNNEGHIFASHFGRGSTLGAAKRLSFYKYIPIINKLIFKILGEKEKRKWINISKSILKRQEKKV